MITPLKKLSIIILATQVLALSAPNKPKIMSTAIVTSTTSSPLGKSVSASELAKQNEQKNESFLSFVKRSAPKSLVFVTTSKYSVCARLYIAATMSTHLFSPYLPQEAKTPSALAYQYAILDAALTATYFLGNMGWQYNTQPKKSQ